jgi:hypothetical protein
MSQTPLTYQQIQTLKASLTTAIETITGEPCTTISLLHANPCIESDNYSIRLTIPTETINHLISSKKYIGAPKEKFKTNNKPK